VRIKFSWVALSVVILSVGLLLVASQDDSLSGAGTVSPAGDRRVRRAHSSVDDTDTTINTTGADGWYAVRQASGDAGRATGTATSPERTCAFCAPGSHSTGADGCCAISWGSTGAVRAVRSATSPDRSHAFCAPGSHPAGADGCCAVS
jgi:hypothetical protein